MGSAHAALKAELSRAQADGRKAAEDLGRASDHARDLLPEISRHVRELVEEGFERLRGQVRDGGKDARDAAEDGFESARLYVVDRVQERPLAVTLAALGVGVVVGLMFASGARK